MELEKLIEALEQHGDSCGLINDDAGNWAVATSGFQNIPVNPPEDMTITFFVEAAQWKPTIREALQAYYDAHVDVDE